MSQGISNIEIKKLFKEINNDDLNEIHGVYPSDEINKFIMFEKKIPGEKYPFLVSNQDRDDQSWVHSWSIANLSPKRELSFLTRME